MAPASEDIARSRSFYFLLTGTGGLLDKKALDLLSFVAVLLSSTQAYAGIMGVVSLSVVGVRFLYALRKSN